MISKSLTLALLVVSAPLLHSQQFVFLDDGMDAADYDSFSFVNRDNDADISFESGNPISNGGNPGGYLEISHFHDVDREDTDGSPVGGNGETALQSVFLDQSTPYAGEDGGAIQSIRFAIDVRTSDFGELGFALEKPDGGSLIFEHTLNPNGQWQTYETTVLSKPDGTILGADFSQPGPFRFGFSLSSDADVTFGSEQLTYDTDNFVVTFNQVPEPSTGILIGLAGGLFAFRRRRLK